MMWQLLAQVEPPLGGWGNLILQGGAFGLLTYIVVWMYPQSQKVNREEREKRDASFATLATVMQEHFETRNNFLIRAIQDQTDRLARKLDEQSVRQAESMGAALVQIIKQLHADSEKRGKP